MLSTTWWMQIVYAVWVVCGYAFIFLTAAAVIRLLRWIDSRRRESRHGGQRR
jgi:uncharacterized membrane protein